MWLSALIMVVIPLILSTLALGVAGLGDLKRLGRIGLVTLVCFVGLTTLSTVLGLTVMNLVRPGETSTRGQARRADETYRGEAQDAMGLSGEGLVDRPAGQDRAAQPGQGGGRGRHAGGDLLRADGAASRSPRCRRRRRRRWSASSRASATSRWRSSSW